MTHTWSNGELVAHRIVMHFAAQAACGLRKPVARLFVGVGE